MLRPYVLSILPFSHNQIGKSWYITVVSRGFLLHLTVFLAKRPSFWLSSEFFVFSLVTKMLFVHFLLLGVTHRDLKLENILLSEDNQPIVTDFGFARYIGSIENQRARSRTFCGSYAYVAPEILQGTHVALDCYLLIAYGPLFLFFSNFYHRKLY